MRTVRINKKRVKRRSSSDTSQGRDQSVVTSREDLLARIERVLTIIDECETGSRNA